MPIPDPNQPDPAAPTWENPAAYSAPPGVMAPAADSGASPSRPTATPTPLQGGPPPAPTSAPFSPSPQQPSIQNQQQYLPQPYQGPAQRGGAVKNALTRMMYGMGQAMMQHVGLPTDYDIQKQNYQQALQAAQLQVQQMHERTLEQASQFQQQSVDTPLGPMPKQTWDKIGPVVYGGLLRNQGIQLKPRTLDQRLGAAIQDSIDIGENPGDNPAVNAFSAAITGKQKPNEMQQYVTNYLQKNGLAPTADNWLQAHADYVNAKAQPQFAMTQMRLGPQWANVALRQKAFDRDTFGTLFGQAIPSSLVDEQGDTIGWKSPSAPTGTIKSQAQQAQDLGQLFRDVRAEIKKADAAGLLGPGMGRLNDFMTGKVGADNPEFAKLRTLNSMVLTGAMKAHFGARGGQQMYQHFEDLYNTGRMTGGNLLGSLDGFQTFMDQYAKRVQTAGGNKPAVGGSPQNAIDEQFGKFKRR